MTRPSSWATEVFDAISHERVLVMWTTVPAPHQGANYVVQINDNAYRFTRSGGAALNSWVLDRTKARSIVVSRLTSKHCESHRLADWDQLMPDVKKSLRN
ncbi:hypothetical protein [Halocatena halophila]|uniref:hypothetical protein n=1 Tax=Halocatena halophila TaxID=2814576 RepID=UPI002ED6AF18